MTAENVARIQPSDSAIAEPYWAGCAKGELRLQYCCACEQYQFYPRIMCSHCGDKDLEWRATSGRGKVASFTVVRRGISAAYPAPYVVALVALAEGPTMMTQVLADQPEDVVVGQSVSVRFERWDKEHILPVFVPVEQVV